MDFSLTADQNAFVETARRFAEERLAPHYRQREQQGRIEPEIVRAMGELGLLGAELPEALGGMGQSCLTSGLILEAIASGDFNVAYLNVLTSLCGQIISRYAAPDVASQWLPAILSGQKMVAICLTEPRGGSDAANLQLKARRVGDDFVLDGEKTSISLATQADVAVVFARTGTPESGARGISAFLAPMDAKGVSRSHFNDLGTRAVGRGSIFFDGVRIPAAWMLGDENLGFSQVMQGFDYSRALIGLQCLAVAERSLNESWAYVREREAFGRPLAGFQGVAFPLAESETYLQACRLLCLKTLWLKDQGQPHTAEAAMCKWWGPKLSCDIIHQCLLVHGHAGYSDAVPYEQRLRDVIGLQIGDGTAQIMKMIVARQKSGRVAASA